jgi:exodeoxyribonuclease-5/deoxyribonuclease V
MLKAAVDVFYKEDRAKAVCILFEEWTSKDVFSTHVAIVHQVAAYEPGAFYKRELPCLLKVLQQVNLSLIEAVVVDGYVYLDDEKRNGLGAHLYTALQEKVTVIGVAKSRFHQSNKHVVPVYRGKSRNPLFVTAAGINVNAAAAAIQSMAGDYRMPDLLQYLDRKTKEESWPEND